ncbi:MAG: serine hydrolase domain-containing protein, partial [Bacteroidota bacterium]
SVSKQFTAMGIVLLHLQGKLSIDDDIRKYLPELPEFEVPVTIRHMMHHTSGLRSLHALLELAGWRSDDTRTNKDLYRFMQRQRHLNFTPGAEYLYCNTGYMFMADIIERITGEPFAVWMQTSIFEPLGMLNTYVEDVYNRVVPNNATSYYNTKNGFERAVEYWGYVGSGNMHATTNDLMRWLSNFYDPKPGWEAPFELLQTLDKLNSGAENTYAFGVGINNFNGFKRIQHSGAIGGFRSFACTYPDQRLNIVVLTNFSSSSPVQKANKISEILLGKAEVKTILNAGRSPVKTVKRSNRQLRQYVGSYWNDTDNYARKIYLKKDTLRYFRSENNESALAPVGNHTFQMLGVDGDVQVRFTSGKNGAKTMLVTIDGGPPILADAFTPVSPSNKGLQAYTGEFYSPELETTYAISVKDKKLFYHHARHGDAEMKFLKKDVLEGKWPFNIVKFKSDASGRVEGILVSNGRVRNLWFEKRN